MRQSNFTTLKFTSPPRLLVAFTASAGAAVVLTLTLIFTLTSPASGQALPDLVMSNVTVDSENWVDGDTITFGYTITNSGTAEATSSSSGLYLSADQTISIFDTLLFEDTSTGIMSVGEVNPEGEPNSFVLDLSSLGVPPGTYYVGAIADHTNVIAESDENNNFTSGVNIVVVSIADDFIDLVVSDLTVGTTSWTDGATITYGWTITNAGTAEAPTSASGLYLSTNTTITLLDTLLRQDSSTGTMPAGEINSEGEPNSFVFDLDALGLPPGPYYLGAIADHDSIISESNEFNNATAEADVIAITIVPDNPDLVISGLTVGSTYWVDGDAMNFAYNVENIGTSSAADSASGLYLSTNNLITTSDVLLLADLSTGTMSVGEVNPEGEPNTFAFDLDGLALTPGIYYLGAIADTGGVVAESNESNNYTGGTDVIAITVVDDVCNGLAMTVNIGAGQSPTSGADVILGTPDPDYIDGLGGDDVICGGEGSDVITGGDGSDTIFGGPGNDDIFGGPHADTIFGGAGIDSIFGEDANDLIYGNTDNDLLHGGAGVDRIFGHGGNDTIWGDDGDDRLYGGTGNDLIFGNLGADRIWGQGDLDSLFGDDGADIIYGGVAADQIFGGAHNDVIHGQGGDDTITGDHGADTIYGHPGDDVIDGGTGSDQIFGHGGSDALNGGNDGDTIFGGGGSDTIHGDAGDDTLSGQGANDTLYGDAGTDTCDGGAGGADTATTCENTSGIP